MFFTFDSKNKTKKQQPRNIPVKSSIKLRPGLYRQIESIRNRGEDAVVFASPAKWSHLELIKLNHLIVVSCCCCCCCSHFERDPPAQYNGLKLLQKKIFQSRLRSRAAAIREADKENSQFWELILDYCSFFYLLIHSLQTERVKLWPTAWVHLGQTHWLKLKEFQICLKAAP